jgi:pimeloyl-ACP methyl ester carboxylesterase
MKKGTIQTLSNIFPSFFAKKFYNRLLNPQIKKIRKNELETLKKAEKKVLIIQNNKIQLYKWGNGENKILLVHGWEGQAGNFSYLIEKFLVENFTIYSFDGPGHGNSSKGKNVMFEYLDTVDKIITKLDIKNIVSHSFGSVVTTFALSQIPNHKIDSYVLLTTPYTFSNYVSNISKKTGISNRAINIVLKKIEKERNEKIDEFDVSKYVQNINVEKAIIIHDVNDRIIPISKAEEVAEKWNSVELVAITNTGHFKMLRTTEVANIIIEFIGNKNTTVNTVLD